MQISELLVKSMLRDGGCSKVWREHYHEMMSQSHNLCLHVLETLDTIKTEVRHSKSFQNIFAPQTLMHNIYIYIKMYFVF